MTTKWLCIVSDSGFTKGRVYKEDSTWLIDDDKDIRLSAKMYNEYSKPNFTRIPLRI